MAEDLKKFEKVVLNFATENNEQKATVNDNNEECVTTFEPVTKLEIANVDDGEKNLVEIIKLRAKIYRYDTSEEKPQYKERGTGLLRIMRVKDTDKFRIIMRREKTLKLCANHYIVKGMELKPMSTNEKAWVWTTLADNCDGESRHETLAVRFSTVKDATFFKTIFELCTDPTPESIKKIDEEIDKQKPPSTQEPSKSITTTDELTPAIKNE